MRGVLIECFRAFFNHFTTGSQPRNICKVELTNKNMRKITKILGFSAFNKKLNHSHPLCTLGAEIQKVLDLSPNPNLKVPASSFQTFMKIRKERASKVLIDLSGSLRDLHVPETIACSLDSYFRLGRPV